MTVNAEMKKHGMKEFSYGLYGWMEWNDCMLCFVMVWIVWYYRGKFMAPFFVLGLYG